MSWRLIDQQRHGPKPRERVTLRLDDSGRLQICLGGGLVERLGWEGQERVEVFRGEGADLGRIIVRAVASGGRRLSRAGGPGYRNKICRARRLTIAGWPGLNEHAAALTAASFSVHPPGGAHPNGAIQIAIPRHWLLARVEAA